MDNNIFDYATSELSQDAMICWLIKYSDDKYKSSDKYMNAVGKKLLESFLVKANITLPDTISIEIEKQLYGIDIVIDLNKNITIAIEDKKYTSHHNNQLARYKKCIEEDDVRKNNLKAFFYFKSEYFLPDELLLNSGFIIYDRNDLVKFLSSIHEEAIQNDVLNSYYSYINKKEAIANLYKTESITKWKWGTCLKFYTLLNEKYKNINGNYVPNASGGFLGCWWNFIDIVNTMHVYIQIETRFAEIVKSDLCFKIGEIKNDDYRGLRQKWYECLVKSAKENNCEIEKTSWRLGACMTVAKMTNDIRVTNNENEMLLDLDCTIKRIDLSLKVLNYAAKLYEDCYICCESI